MRMMLALVIGLTVTPAMAQLHPTGRAVITQAVEDAIRPGFAAYATDTAALKTELDALCATPSQATVEAAHAGFADVVTAWSAIENYRFGPLVADNRTDRILFWPDRKGIALKQVQGALAGADESVLDPKSLRGKSVAMQGLGALEYLLYGTDAEQLTTAAGAYRCGYALSISTLLADTAAQMSAEWNDPEGISARLIRPSETDADYRSNDEVLTELVGVMAHGIEAIRDQRILPFYGRDGAASKPKSALFWRSNLTLPSIVASFSGLETLLVASDIWEYTPTEQFRIGEEAQAEFKRIADEAGKVTGTVEAALADPAQKAAIGEIVTASQKLGTLTGEELPAALGLSVGFSSLDGD